MRRRDFLAAVAVAGAAAAGVARWLRRSEAGELATASRAPAAPEADGDPESIVPTEDMGLFLALADVIVPRDGDLPAASEIDLWPRLERWVRSSDSRLRLYRRSWPALRKLLQSRLARAGDRPRAVVLHEAMRFCHRAYRRQERPEGGVRFAEQIRRDVLRVYYASPAGWASVGYTGPAHRSHPLGRRAEDPA